MSNVTPVGDMPADYHVLKLKSAFPNYIGEFYERLSERGRSVAVRIEPHHCNSAGVAHGGFLLALADLSLSYGSYEPNDGPPRITLSLTTDFAGVARVGDWVEAHVDVQKAGRRTVFANCFICVGDKRIVRASGVFMPERAE
jgi:acyl-coenzyme A thioesterase 13